MTVYFSSDQHFGHNNIIKYQKRPFNNVKEMNDALINNWNSVVKDDDVVYCLGDFSFCKDKRTTNDCFFNLKGKKHLVIGNHDNNHTLSLPWETVTPYLELNINKKNITMMHYAMRVWHHSYRGNWMLYGHSHGMLIENDTMSCDVGVDVWNYTPVSFETLNSKFEWKKNKPDYYKCLFAHVNDGEIHSEDIKDHIREKIKNLNVQFVK